LSLTRGGGRGARAPKVSHDGRAALQDHPTTAIDELLPGAWAATRDDA
jgi:hypothetical protein